MSTPGEPPRTLSFLLTDCPANGAAAVTTLRRLVDKICLAGAVSLPVARSTGKFTEMVSEDIVFMLNANLFRALPPSKGGDQENYDPDEEEPSLEPTWPHLQACSPVFSCLTF